MWPDWNFLVAKPGAQNHLQIDDRSIESGQKMNRGTPAIFQLRLIGNPPFARKYGNAQDRRKDDLREAGMQNGKPVVQQLDDDLTPENRLHGDSANGNRAKPSQPGPLFFRPHKDFQNERKSPQSARDHPMGVLGESTSDPR